MAVAAGAGFGGGRRRSRSRRFGKIGLNTSRTRSRRFSGRRRSSGGSVRGPGEREEGTSGRGKGKRMNKAARRRNKRRAVEAIQRRLRRKGYRIAVDGIMGPQTRSAIAANRSGQKPKKWNRQHGHGGGSSRGGGGGHGGHGGGGRGGGGHGGGRGRGGGGGISGKANSALINPGKAARAATNLQYGSVLRELRRQLTENEAQGKQNLVDIGEWFDDVEGTRAEATESNLAAGQASEADLGAATSAIISALGGSANPGSAGVGAAGASGRAALAAQNRSQQNFDTNLASIIGLQETDALRDETRFQAETEKGLRGQLADLLKEKGFAHTANLSEARQTRLQQQAAIQNMQLASSMAGLDSALKMAQLGAMGQDAQIKQLQIADFIRTAGGRAEPGFGDLDPGQLAGLEDRLRDMFTGNRGGFNLAPQKAYNQMGAALRRIGYDPRKSNRIDSFRDSLIRDILRRTQATGSWRRTRIGREGVPIGRGGRVSKNAI